MDIHPQPLVLYSQVYGQGNFEMDQAIDVMYRAGSGRGEHPEIGQHYVVALFAVGTPCCSEYNPHVDDALTPPADGKYHWVRPPATRIKAMG